MTQTKPPADAGTAAAAPQDQWSPRVSAAMLARLAARAAVAAPAETTPVEAPFTCAVLATVPKGRPADIEAACASAREAQAEWARRPVEEVLDVAIQARYYAHAAGSCLREQRRQGALPLLTSTRVHHRPRGVIGVITPWNYPFTLAIGDALPALVAGDGVVLKPAVPERRAVRDRDDAGPAPAQARPRHQVTRGWRTAPPADGARRRAAG